MERATKIFVWLAAANLVAFVVAANMLGGDAIRGLSTHGRYFLGKATHLTEVSQTVFLYSQWHAISVFVTLPIAIALLSGMMNTRMARPASNDLRRSLP